MSTPTKQDRTCERCGRKHLGEFVWLELDSVSGDYHEPGEVAPERSQGLFSFGKYCSVKTLNGATIRLTRRV